MVHVNYVAVLVATVAVFVLGWLWYSPLLFFKPWMRLRGMDPVAAMAGAKMPAGKLLIELARCLVLACVIARLVALLPDALAVLADVREQRGLFLLDH